MKAGFLALLAPLTLAAAPVDYTRVVSQSAEGGFVMGNPGARVKLVEYASLTCSHCRDFNAQSSAALRGYVARGQVSYEYRAFVLNGADLVAAVLARCDGPARFFPRVEQFYRQQEVWAAPYGQVDAAAQERYAAAPAAQKLLVLAQVGKLDGYAVKAGIPAARVRQCLTNPALRDRLVQMTQAGEARGVTGTPTFYMDGQQLSTNSWSGIEPLLRTKLGLAKQAG